MDTADLLRFLRDANQRGYAAGRAARQHRESDHSTTIAYEMGEWTFHDNYFGGEPYGGRSVVFRKGRPVWVAVYYGRVEGAHAPVQASTRSCSVRCSRHRAISPSAARSSSALRASRTETLITATWEVSAARRPFTTAGSRCTRPGTAVVSSTGGRATDVEAADLPLSGGRA